MPGRQRLIRIKKSTLLLLLAAVLAISSPVLADYLGPDRTVTTAVEVCKVVLWECQFVPAKGDWRYKRADEWSCASEGKEWQAYDNVGPECGMWSDGRSFWEREYSVRLTTVTHPEATIAGEIQNCALQNSIPFGDGWCVTSPQLALTANEPLSGYNILIIEGARSGEAFACNASSCAVPLNEGVNDFSYWALSSWGDSSRKGAMTVKVDTVLPNLNLLVNGTLGLNNWYVSNTTITAEGADGTSGIFEKVLSIDNEATWIPSTTLTDGVYHVDIKITDNAYNISTASTTIQVDTTTPALSLSISGTKGENNYYASKPKIAATTSDAASGVALVQVEINNGAWIDTNEITLDDGIHAYRFRVYDNAGNVTETPVQQIKVDTTPPAIDLTEKLDLGDIFEYNLQDDGSGLSAVRLVIEDEKERFPKVVWLEPVSGNKFKSDFVWDGKWKDKSTASVGEYLITVKASDAAGNESINYGLVTVDPLSYFQAIPEFIPPENTQASNETPSNEEERSQPFGGTNNNLSGGESAAQTLTFTGAGTAGATASANTTTSNIFWAGAAAALIGWATATALQEQKKRQEEEAAQIAHVTAAVAAKNAAIEANRIAMMEQLKIQSWLKGQAIFKAHIEALKTQGASKDEIEKLMDQGATQGFGAAIASAETLGQHLAAQAAAQQQALQNFLSTERDTSAADAWQAQELQAGLMAYYLGRKEGESAQEQAEKPWWVPTFTIEKANQLLSAIPSLGLGSPKRNEIPIFTMPLPGNLLSFGTVSTWNPATDGNPHVRVNPNSTGINSAYKNISTALSWDSVNSVLVANVRVASPVNINANDVNAGLGYSISARLEVNQVYNATVGMDINYADVSVKGDGGKANLTDGAYVKINVWVVPAAILAFVLLPKLISFAPGIVPVLEKLKPQPTY